jgi:hypothetical protein
MAFVISLPNLSGDPMNMIAFHTPHLHPDLVNRVHVLCHCNLNQAMSARYWQFDQPSSMSVHSMKSMASATWFHLHQCSVEEGGSIGSNVDQAECTKDIGIDGEHATP